MGKRTGLAVSSVAVLAGLIGVLVAAPTTGYAASMGGNAKYTLSLTKDYTASPWTSEVGYADRVKGKFIFGAKNLLLGWTELFTEPREASQEGGNVLAGIGVGVKNAVEDTLGGAVHLVTFPIPAIDAPLPQGGVGLL